MSIEKKSIVENTLLQIKAVENAISENAKGILASTMKEEISELVKESLGINKSNLQEQDEQDVEDVNLEDDETFSVGDDELEMDDEIEDENEMEDDEMDFEEDEMDSELTSDNEDELPPLDMTHSPMSDVLKVFKAMGDNDGIIIKKDGGNISLKDSENDTEYLIQTGSDSEEFVPHMDENIVYELEIEEEDEMEMDIEEMEMDEEEMEMDIEEEMDEEETVYEMDQEELESVLESFKAKGIGFGKPGNGFSKSMAVNDKGFKEDTTYGGKGKTGKGPKFKYGSIKHGVTETNMEEEEFNEWEEETNEEMVNVPETPETTEASRTLGAGRRFGKKGLPKPKAAPRHLNVESLNNEIEVLREKNEEYKKALDFFRNKLNDVAVFNSNLAYTTRLFTEHSTTKQEKINIIRRFDSVETIKESKNLYNAIKNELDGKSVEVVTESIQTKVSKSPSNGSSANLIESKTYENPQFLRMRDLMSKIK